MATMVGRLAGGFKVFRLTSNASVRVGGQLHAIDRGGQFFLGRGSAARCTFAGGRTPLGPTTGSRCRHYMLKCMPCHAFGPLAVPPTLPHIVIGRRVPEGEKVLPQTKAPLSGTVPRISFPRRRLTPPSGRAWKNWHEMGEHLRFAGVFCLSIVSWARISLDNF